MSERGFKRAVRYWREAIFYGVGSDIFGWGAFIAAIVISYAGHEVTWIAMAETTFWWFLPIASLVTAFILVVVINTFVIAPRRAARMLKPLKIDIVSGYLDTSYPTEKFPRQSAAIVVTNLAHQQLSNCVLHVTEITGYTDNYNMIPRFVCAFTLQPNETQQVQFMSWTTRSAPLKNDNHFTLHGPVGPQFGGNLLSLPCGSYDIDLRVGVTGAEAERILCRVWAVDDTLKIAFRTP